VKLSSTNRSIRKAHNASSFASVGESARMPESDTSIERLKSALRKERHVRRIYDQRLRELMTPRAFKALEKLCWKSDGGTPKASQQIDLPGNVDARS
jgi:hypothetical protein